MIIYNFVHGSVQESPVIDQGPIVLGTVQTQLSFKVIYSSSRMSAIMYLDQLSASWEKNIFIIENDKILQYYKAL